MELTKSLIRPFSIVLLAAFCVTVFLSFSLYIDLRPAKAIFGLGDIVFDPALLAKWMADHAWQIIKSIAKAFFLQFLALLINKMMQKLESVHVIKNFLQYSDALGMDKYIGSALNKLVMKPKTQAEADALANPENENTATLAAKADLNGLSNMTPGQIQDLAMQSQLSSGKAKVDSFVFLANPTKVSRGDRSTITWNVKASGGIVYGKLNGEMINFSGATASGSMTEIMDSTKDFVFEVYEGSNMIGSKCVFVEVERTSGNRCAGKGSTGQSVNKGITGLTPTQEKELLRGGLALLTSQVACGGERPRVIQAIAIYNAAKARGTDPRKIDPSSGNFYTDMYQMGNPFASPYFQELMMRDTAATVEAQAKEAINQELTSNGQKALRSEKNQITRTSQVISDQIQESIAAMFNISINSSDSETGIAIGKLVANLVFKAIFEDNANGRLLVEQGLCGISQIAADGVYRGITNDGTTATPSANIKVNGKATDTLVSGGGAWVRVSWEVKNLIDPDSGSAPSISVSNLPQVCKLSNNAAAVPPSGNCDMTEGFLMTLPTYSSGIITFDLTASYRDGHNDSLGQAALMIQEPPVTTPPPDDTQTTQSLDLLTPAFKIRE